MLSSSLVNAQVDLGYLDHAEQAFLADDFFTAINFATMAKQLKPDLYHADYYLSAYKVHSCARSNPNNWYAVLDIPINLATVDTVYAYQLIKNQFKIMISKLHPDQEKQSVAAAKAFQLVTQAWVTLSKVHYPGSGLGNCSPGFWSDPHPSFWYQPFGNPTYGYSALSHRCTQRCHNCCDLSKGLSENSEPVICPSPCCKNRLMFMSFSIDLDNM